MGKAINIAGGTLTAKDHAVINHCLKDNSIGIGAGFGNEMAYRLDSVNEIAILDGFAMIQGRCYVIYPGDEEKLVIRSGSQGMKRHDLIVIEFDNALEQMDLKILEGIESNDPIDPEITQDDTLGGGNLYQMPMYRVLVDGLNVEIEDIREYLGAAVGKGIDLAKTTFTTPYTDFMIENDTDRYGAINNDSLTLTNGAYISAKSIDFAIDTSNIIATYTNTGSTTQLEVNYPFPTIVLINGTPQNTTPGSGIPTLNGVPLTLKSVGSGTAEGGHAPIIVNVAANDSLLFRLGNASAGSRAYVFGVKKG